MLDIALERSASAVLARAVRAVRETIRSDIGFAAVADGRGRYPLALRDGLRDPRWATVNVAAGQGLGGRVLAEERLRVTDDYLDDLMISGDFRPIAEAEGMRGLACVPVVGPTGITALVL